MAMCVDSALSDRERVHAFLDAHGVARTDSRGNFVFLPAPGGPGQAAARLLAQGIIVRPVATDRGPYLRISLGLPEHTRRLLCALDEILGG
jgi:histidinol-phosphate/aromatic aminotransferase/cobyric acid decarboxylase-like protein